ncbi:unnamed protein product [Tilletia controversa]|uniref:Uncharacterized protein n=3 Tax=Tilletia TaxID=13289 RepID=A0A8X7SWU0_9BASI|nr:hypothetical protein CF336_g6205 [Tilletia laevis]KAE8198944.1 hypothetical protein CF328_g3391 [Tilletia controversa]KAE8264189.1 hypothetical protein A4X03_0g1133 [Tilletia caries]KAE8193313.1 hypothetical protein CF335_g5623 [Tilletia laevis]KAE8247873.1 hypothetical protein A4X06_0g4126 [Tilletia controversa]
MPENKNPGNFRNREKGDVQATAAMGGRGIKGAGPDYTYDPTQDEFAGPKVVPDDTVAADKGDENFVPATEDVTTGSGKQFTDAKGGVGVPATNESGMSGAESLEEPEAPTTAAASEKQELRAAERDEQEIVEQGQHMLKKHPQTTLRTGKEISL